LQTIKTARVRNVVPDRTRGTTALKLRPHLNPLKGLCATPVREILSPSLWARIGIFGSAAATKCASPRGDGPTARISPTCIVHGLLAGFRYAQVLAMAPPVRLLRADPRRGEPKQSPCFSRFTFISFVIFSLFPGGPFRALSPTPPARQT